MVNMEIYYTDSFRQNAESREHSRQLLIRVLRHYCGLPGTAEILTDRRGRRYVDGRYGLCFSVTHTEHLWYCCVSKKKIGIDAELWSRTFTRTGKLARRFLTAEEQSYLFSVMDEEEQRKRLLYLWTRKEAYLKYTGEGLSGLRWSPSVVHSPGNTVLRTFEKEDACVSVCAEQTVFSENPRWIRVDGHGAEDGSETEKNNK